MFPPAAPLRATEVSIPRGYDNEGNRGRPTNRPGSNDRSSEVDTTNGVRQTYPLMVVCHCNRVSDHQIRTAAIAGACDIDEVGAMCGAGTRCGSCRPAIQAILDEVAVSIASAPVVAA